VGYNSVADSEGLSLFV